MEKGDKGSTLTRMGVSGWMFLLVPAYPGCPGQMAVKWLLLLLLCAAVYRECHLVKATEVTAGLAESNGSLLPGIWRDWLHVTCGLTACTPGSAPGPTLGNEYGKTLLYLLPQFAILWAYNYRNLRMNLFTDSNYDSFMLLGRILRLTPQIKWRLHENTTLL